MFRLATELCDGWLGFIHPRRHHNARNGRKHRDTRGTCAAPVSRRFVTRVPRNYGNGRPRHNGVAFSMAKSSAGKDEYLIWESASRSCECGRPARGIRVLPRCVRQRTSRVGLYGTRRHRVGHIVARWGSQNYRFRRERFSPAKGRAGKESFSFFSSERPSFPADRRDKSYQ